MEIYRDDPNPNIFIPVPANVIPAVTEINVLATDGSYPIYEFSTVTGVVEANRTGYQVTLPWELSREGRDFYLDWQIKYTEGTEVKEYRTRSFVQIVTPLLPASEIAEITSESDVGRVAELERRVRYAIQTYSGQNFGRFRSRVTLTGDGQGRLTFPFPLLAVFSANFNLNNYYLYNDNWNLGFKPTYSGGIKEAPTEEHIDNYMNGGVIRPPVLESRIFRQGVMYSIDGIWGYHDVPGDIQECARMLVDDFSCDESLWRERYIKSVRSGNWRFELDEGTFHGTGNVTVDEILNRYRRLTMRIV